MSNNTYSTSSSVPDEDDSDVRRFEQIFDDAKNKLVQTLREKKLEAANSSSEQLKSVRRQLLQLQIEISKLTQENSQLREEKRRSDLSLKLSEDTSTDLQRKWQEERKRREEIELALQDKTGVIQSLRLQLYEKDTEILRLKNEGPSYQSQTGHGSEASTPGSENRSSSRQTATSSSSSLGHYGQQESEEAVSTSNPEPTRAHTNARVKKQSLSTESIPSSMYNPECPTDLDEDRSSHWTSPVSHTRIKSEPIDDRMTNEVQCAPPQRSISRISVESTPPQSQPQPHPSPSSSSTSGGRFELSAKRSLLRPSYIDEQHQAVKRMRRGSGQSSASSGASGSSRSSSTISKTSNSNLNSHTPSSSSAAVTNRISVLDIPERLRLNYGFITNWDLDHCPHARDFWCDTSKINYIKYLIRFYDDDTQQCKDPLNSKRFCVKEQVQLQEPTMHSLKLKDFVRRMERNLQGSDGECGMRQVRLWVDVRDFNVYATDISWFFHQFGQFISHFTIGRRLYSSEEVRPGLILNFIFRALPNLEYLGINDGMLKPMDHDVKNLPQNNLLSKLKVIRLISINSRFAIPFITELLIRAPSLTHLYGLPIHCLSELELYLETTGQRNIPPWIFPTNTNTNTNLDSDSDCYISMQCVKSVQRSRFDTHQQLHQEFKKYLSDLTTLVRLHPPLQIIDARTFFIRDPETRRQSVRKWTELLQIAAPNVQILTVEPVEIGSGNIPDFPRMDYCDTLNFDMNAHIESDSGLGYFPPTFDWSYSFPSLRAIQVSLDEKNSHAFGKNESKLNELYDHHFPQDLFKPSDTFKRIEKLSLVEFAPYCLIGKFHGLFQRITILSLKLSLIEMSKILPKVFKFWPGLQQLNLDIGFASRMDYNLDSAFTGIHYKQCRALRESLNGMKPGEKVEMERIQKEIIQSQRETPISNLKELTVLKIVLTHKGKVEFEPSDCLFTPVAAIYGFGRERMPNLRTVIIGFDDRVTSHDKRCMMKVLKPMRPYVTIDY